MIGKVIQNYTIQDLIDEGGMGSIYIGTHKSLPRKVAIKVLNPLLRNKPEIIERFKNEALILSSLQHPNIVALYDYLENKEANYIIMEYIEGETLAEYIETTTGPIPQKRTISLFLKILDAIDYAHNKNIIHRDIKPANFIVGKNNNIKILDFGIAKSIGSISKSLTQTGLKVGTTLFMSPQQVRGQVLDRRTDIYSLGVTLFQMVTGQLPYDENDTEYDLYNLIVNHAFPNPKDFYVGVTNDMHKIIQKATSKRPLDRYQSCDEFSKALLSISKDTKVHIPLSMKTKIFDIANADEDKPAVLNRTFWRNLILLVLTSLFSAALGFGFYFVIKSDMRHIIANEQILYKSNDENSKKIENLKFGETVKVISLKNENLNSKSKWLKVVSLRGNSGYVGTQNIEKPKIYEQINKIFNNNEAQKRTPVFYKKLLRNYFVLNKLFNRVNTDWKLFALNKEEFEFNFIAKADFNNNEIEDYACILENTFNKDKRLLIFIDNDKKPIVFIFTDDIKIKTLKKGKKGGAWYLGFCGRKMIINC